MKNLIAITLKLGFVMLFLASGLTAEGQIVRRTYSPWDYSSGTASQLVLTNARGQIIAPLGVPGYPGINTFNGYYWRQSRGVWYAYDQNPAVAGATARRIDMKTNADARDRLVRTLGSRKYKKARKAVVKDLDDLGGLSAISAEFMGFKSNETVAHNPTTSSPLPGKRGDRRNRHLQSSNASASRATTNVSPRNVRAFARKESMDKSLQVLEALSAPTGQDTLAFWIASEMWAHGDDSLRSELEAKSRYDRWNTLISTTKAGLIRSTWPAQADGSLRVWRNWSGPTATFLVRNNYSPQPLVDDSVSTDSSFYRTTASGDSVLLNPTQAGYWLTALEAKEAKDVVRHLAAYKDFCNSLMPATGQKFPTAANKALAEESWEKLGQAWPAGSSQRQIAEFGLVAAKATPAE